MICRLGAFLSIILYSVHSDAFVQQNAFANPKSRLYQAVETSSFQTSLVDMNSYNLPLQSIAEQWTANLVPESSLRAEGVYLGAKSESDVMVDTVKIEGIARRKGEGLGIQLLELAGGRSDGIGITVVDGLVEGGCCDGCGILEGDSIIKIAIERSKQFADKEIASVGTECLGYDATVDAILSLPPAEDDDESISITVKRLRRKPKVMINFQYPPSDGIPDTKIELFAGENLRRAMLSRGVKLNDPLSRRFDSGGSGDCELAQPVQ